MGNTELSYYQLLDVVKAALCGHLYLQAFPGIILVEQTRPVLAHAPSRHPSWGWVSHPDHLVLAVGAVALVALDVASIEQVRVIVETQSHGAATKSVPIGTNHFPVLQPELQFVDPLYGAVVHCDSE